MNEQTQRAETPAHRAGPAAVVLEALAIAVVGVCLALAANQISPHGLNLTRNYFPETKPVPAPVLAVTNAAPGPSAATNTTPSAENTVASETEAATARLKSKGLQVVTLDQVKKLLHDPGYAQGLIIVVDARDDDHYQAGHIPGAYQLDYYHPDKYLTDVVPACQKAKQVVVYCTGGDCEDSDMTAIMLRDGGIPGEKLFVYGGGMNEWETTGQPEETGARNSGQMRTPEK